MNTNWTAGSDHKYHNGINFRYVVAGDDVGGYWSAVAALMAGGMTYKSARQYLKGLVRG